MASQNIKLKKGKFTVDRGYFYMFDQDQDSLLQKTDDGNTSFSYPFDTLMGAEVKSAEFDGMYFWSMEVGISNEMIIRRWLINNYICKLQQTINLLDSGVHHYSSEAFSIEHYHTTLSSDVSVSGTSLYLNKYSDHYSMNFTSTSGNGVILQLGPNSNNEWESVEVDTVISGGVTLVSPTQYSYSSGDAVNYYTNLWIFNDYNGISSATGALYKIDAYTGDFLAKYPGGEYKAIKAATFYSVNSFDVYGIVDTLCFVKNTNILFVNLSEIETSLEYYYGSMVMDNIEADEITVISIYDLAMDSQNVYRLQKVGGVYNYELSSLDSFVTSISLAAYPSIIAANLTSTSNIVAYVKDQFLQPIISRAVNFSDDDSNGAVAPIQDNTDSSGRAQTVYTAGSEAREVKITAVVEQT